MDPKLVEVSATPGITLRRIAAYRGIRVLAWAGDVLYACRGYETVRLQVKTGATTWQRAACFHPAWWRNLTSRIAVTSRLARDGFHALTILKEGTMVGAVPGAILTRKDNDGEFAITHRIVRGTRPLHVTAAPTGKIYWGEYFDNRERADVHIYGSEDRGQTWHVAYTFPKGSIRHIHNIVHDPWVDCLWILTGDEGAECKLLQSSCDLRSMGVVLEGNQQSRAVAAIPTRDGLYLSTDTPSEQNHVYRLNRNGGLESLGDLASSSIYGCRVGEAFFFSTMAEPSAVNVSSEIHLVGGRDGSKWRGLLHWKKDRLSMRYFQYGNAILPDGENTTQVLALTTVAVEAEDMTTTLWRVD